MSTGNRLFMVQILIDWVHKFTIATAFAREIYKLVQSSWVFGSPCLTNRSTRAYVNTINSSTPQMLDRQVTDHVPWSTQEITQQNTHQLNLSRTKSK